MIRAHRAVVLRVVPTSNCPPSWQKLSSLGRDCLFQFVRGFWQWYRQWNPVRAVGLHAEQIARSEGDDADAGLLTRTRWPHPPWSHSWWNSGHPLTPQDTPSSDDMLRLWASEVSPAATVVSCHP
jgi:hypothetical protein